MCQLNIAEADFWSKYKPINHPVDGSAEYKGCMLDITDDDFKYVIPGIKENRVWTVVDTDGGLFIMAGLRFVNRYGYIVTEKPWDDENQFVDEGNGFPKEEKKMNYLLLFNTEMARQAYLKFGSEILKSEFPNLYRLERYTDSDNDGGLKDVVDYVTTTQSHEYISKAEYEYLALPQF